MKSLAHLVFGLFSGEIMTYFENVMSLQRGFPPKLGNPPENREFQPISSRNVHSDNQTQCNDTCFVQNFDLKPLLTPFPHHPPHPITSPPFPYPSCPYPLASFCNPFPPTICPPLPKVNRQLKIVNYFTCMQHLFCRW